MEERIVRYRDVFNGRGSLSGLSKSTGRALVKQGRFPKPFAISPGLHGWWLSDVMKALRALGETAQPAEAVADQCLGRRPVKPDEPVE